MQILLQPFEDVREEVLHNLRVNLPYYFPGSEAILSDTVWEMPDNALSRRRDQYLARYLLEELSAWGDEYRYSRVLGVCKSDLYATGFNFIFGEAEYPGTSAIISLRRLGGSLEEERERALKESIHELGHTFGLRHCRKPACIMSFSKTLEDTDMKGLGFCEKCFMKLNSPSGKPVLTTR